MKYDMAGARDAGHPPGRRRPRDPPNIVAVVPCVENMPREPRTGRDVLRMMSGKTVESSPPTRRDVSSWRMR